MCFIQVAYDKKGAAVSLFASGMGIPTVGQRNPRSVPTEDVPRD